MGYESVEIPFVNVGNRRGLTGQQIVEQPWLQEFIKRFPCSFEPMFVADILLFIEPGGSDGTIT